MLLNDGKNDDSFYECEKCSCDDFSGMCLIVVIPSCDLGNEFYH